MISLAGKTVTNVALHTMPASEEGRKVPKGTGPALEELMVELEREAFHAQIRLSTKLRLFKSHVHCRFELGV